ncbi:hypothetical protein [Comamonas thiooxydans]|uniref:hypothetical protein n=1 Tax=Comamonas thiooxydans TaxID=363952 RepID=UPI0011247AE9|nr:hypothetical protein [Comamonas thiooxydans]
MSALFRAPDLEVLTESSKNRDSSASAVDELNRASSTSMLQGSCSTAKTKGFQPIFRGFTVPLLERQDWQRFTAEQSCSSHACKD